MRRILITGSTGQLGKELINKLSGDNHLIIANREDLDITNEISTNNFVQANKPDIIINCAAFTAVDLCETEEQNAYNVNAIAPKNLALASKRIGSKLVHISTDYVFDGEGVKNEKGIIRPYVENDAVNPQSVYGKTKLEGENFVIKNCDKYFIIRTAWLYGDGKNFVRTMINLSKSNEKVNVVNDQIGSPTSTKELANMIEKLMITDNYGMYHGTCEGFCTWYDLTCKIYEILNIKTKVVPVTSEEFVRPAKRPKYSVLENKKLNDLGQYKFKHWKDALKIYLSL